MNRITVIGAGTMGHGIAQVAAMAGYETVLTDVDEHRARAGIGRIEQNLRGGVKRGKVTEEDATAALARVSSEPSLEAAVSEADLVVEAILEDLSAKKTLFQTIERHIATSTILATNTSSLSVSDIAHATARPERVVGMHFFNPVHIMKLVEIVHHKESAQETIEVVRRVAIQMGKEPILVGDVPGFASSRLGVVLGLEAMRMVEQGVASAEDIDKALELGYGHPMGPLKVTDLVGLDVRLAIAQYLHETLQSPHYAPPAILKEKVEAGQLGKKTGKGFYEWPTPTS